MSTQYGTWIPVGTLSTCVQVYKCLHNMATGYLSALCQPVSRCTSVYTTWHLDTCRHSANLFSAFLVAVTYAQLVMVNWTSPVSICQRTADGCLPTPVLHPGTRCLTISRTLIFPFKLSNVILRHSVTYVKLVMVNWTSPVSICQRTADGCLPTPVLHPGTRCLTISRTLIFPFKRHLKTFFFSSY